MRQGRLTLEKKVMDLEAQASEALLAPAAAFNTSLERPPLAGKAGFGALLPTRLRRCHSVYRYAQHKPL